MDLQLNKQSLAVRKCVVDETAECPIDISFTLPDYCPGIDRILKCEIKPTVISINSMSAKVTVDGRVCYNLIYCASDGQIYSYEGKEVLSKQFEIPMSAENAVFTASIKKDYANCRAISERRIDIHGAVIVCITGIKKQEYNFVSGCDHNMVQLKKQKCEAYEFCFGVQKQFSIEEEIEISQGDDAIMRIIKCETAVLCDECKFIINKAIVKATLNIDILYMSTSSKYEKLSASFPISQIIDADGANEQCVSVCNIDCCTAEFKTITNSDGECRNILCEFMMNATLEGYRECNVDYACDAFCTEYESVKEEENMPIHIPHLNTGCILAKEQISLETPVFQIIDICTDIINTHLSNQNEEAELNAEIEADIFYIDENGMCNHHQHKFDVSGSVGSAGVMSDISANIKISSLSYNITGAGSIELRFNLCADGGYTEQNMLNMLCEIKADESRPKNSKLNGPVLYFADEGDEIWDIACRYNTSPSMIMKVNSLDNDKLSCNKALLIPAI